MSDLEISATVVRVGDVITEYQYDGSSWCGFGPYVVTRVDLLAASGRGGIWGDLQRGGRHAGQLMDELSRYRVRIKSEDAEIPAADVRVGDMMTAWRTVNGVYNTSFVTWGPWVVTRVVGGVIYAHAPTSDPGLAGAVMDNLPAYAVRVRRRAAAATVEHAVERVYSYDRASRGWVWK